MSQCLLVVIGCADDELPDAMVAKTDMAAMHDFANHALSSRTLLSIQRRSNALSIRPDLTSQIRSRRFDLAFDTCALPTRQQRRHVTAAHLSSSTLYMPNGGLL